ncbi:transglycosylase domain-containing protein [Nocardia stercoris]|uniref:Penicillin-binding protein n=1 Tax=Nocardia stercoris TaxID=2483361 RepID=A0A3M2LAG3_9NOCA|nr:penicillin-binding protein [Nocardia stercoris]
MRQGLQMRPVRHRAPAPAAPADTDTGTRAAVADWTRSGRRAGRLVLALFLIFLVVPALLCALAYWSAQVPRPSAVQTNQIATVTAADGTTVLAKIIPPEGNRTLVKLDDVPMPVRDAVLAAEDRNFYSNPGFSTQAFLRAARDNLLGRQDAGGGSTITQQYVKNAFLDSERSLTRKMRELIISAKMARQWSKDDILAAYLNTIYYGRGAYGISAAARAYFDKHVPDLTLAEGAVLASVIRTPSLLDPETHHDQLVARWNYVLDGMVTMGKLTPDQRAAQQFPNIIGPSALDDATHTPNGLIRTRVLDEMRAAGITDDEINTGALRITTTIDRRAQQAAVDAVHSTLDNQPPDLRTAVVSIDPRTGAVRAYYGGDDGVGYDFAQAPLQTGSSFKTFAVLAAVQQNVPLSYQLDSGPITVNGVSVSNVGNETCGTCSLAEAFKRSLNTSFYRLTETVGPQAVADAAHAAGIPERIPGVAGTSLTDSDTGTPSPSIALGVYSVRPIDMASAYATLAASGMYHSPYFVQKVVTGDGRVLLDHGNPAGTLRVTAAAADTTTHAMLPIAGYSNGHDLAGRPSAAKTGTTQLGDTGADKDAWMIGFTPSLSTAVWIGTEQPQAITTRWGGPIYGSGLPADIWKRTMDGALADSPVEQFAQPTDPPLLLDPGPPPPGEAPAPPAPAPAWSGPDPSAIGPAAPAPAPAPQQAPLRGGPFDTPDPGPPPEDPAPGLLVPPPNTPREVQILPGLTIQLPG